LPPSYDPELASYLRIEERELKAGGLKRAITVNGLLRGAIR